MRAVLEKLAGEKIIQSIVGSVKALEPGEVHRSSHQDEDDLSRRYAPCLCEETRFPEAVARAGNHVVAKEHARYQLLGQRLDRHFPLCSIHFYELGVVLEAKGYRVRDVADRL